MSYVGKILVFINLLVSLIVGALIVMVFTTRAQWQKGYESVLASYQREHEEFVRSRNDHNKYVAEKTKQLEKNQEELKAKDRDLNDAKDAKDTAIKDKDKATAALTDRDETIKQLQNERNNLTTELANKDKAITDQVTQINKAEIDRKAANDQMVKYKIAAESMQVRMQNLLEQYEKLLKEFEALRTDKATRAGAVVNNPPPEDVKGTIKATDVQSGLITVNLGSDNGLSKGNTLHVYRLTPKPTYVGLLRIMDVRPNESVGKLTTAAARPGTVQVGDEVASKILDNR